MALVEERRSHQRFACDLRARIALASGGAELDGQAIDISFSGICIHTTARVPPKTRATFTVWVALPDRDTAPLSLPGKVVWSTTVEGMEQIGASFDRDLDNRVWTRLDVLLQYIAGNRSQLERLF